MSQPCILIVDNDRDFRESLSDWLLLFGFQIYEADSADAARATLQQARVDLAIIDIRLADDDDPTDLSGLWLCQEITLAIPIIALTGYPPASGKISNCSVEAHFPREGQRETPILIKSEDPTVILHTITRALHKGGEDVPTNNTARG